MESIQPSLVERTAQERHAAIKWVIRVGVLGSTFAAMLNVGFFVQTRAWQMLLVVAGEALAIACLILARKLIRRARFDSAGYWTLLSLAIALGVVELGHSGLTLYIAGGGILTMLLVGRLSMPRKWVVWLVVIGLFLAWVGLINWLEPLPRYDMMNLGALHLLAPFIITLLVLAAFWQILRAYQNIRAIRVRLPISFVSVVLVPVIAISASLGVVGLQSRQQQVVNQLESVARIKEAEIDNWVDNLQNDLNAALSGSQAAPRAVALLQTSDPSESQEFWMRSHFQGIVEQTARFEELFLINLQGHVVLSTDVTQEDKDCSNQAFFQQGLNGFYLQAPIYDLLQEQVLVMAARPVNGPDDQVLGLLVGRVNPETLSDIMGERAWIGDTGEIFLVDRNSILLTALRSPEGPAPQTPIEDADIAIQTQRDGSRTYQDYRGASAIAIYHWLPELEMALVARQDQSEALGVTYSMFWIIGLVTVVALGIALTASLYITRGIAGPLVSLTETATQIAGGDLTLSAPVEQEDEIGTLAQAFNSMTGRLRQTLGGLEQQVAERTGDLERRSAYLEAAAQVGRAATSILDPETLIRRVIEMMREEFDLYYVGLFRVDERREWAVLQAGTGEAGQAMLARGHSIKIGEGMIGWSVANAQTRIALEAGQDAVRLATAELPDTRSEAAIPLRSRGQVIGALTVQSERPQAFDEDLLTALQIVADQMAVALDNARLFAESQSALETSRRAYGEISREAWLQLLQARPDLGFRRDQRGLSRVTEAVQEQMSEPKQQNKDAKETLIRPVKVRDHVIGTINARKSLDGGSWADEEIKLLETLTDQLGLALEGARLYQETQRRALQERLTRQITDKVRAAPDINSIAQTAAEELVKALGGVRGFVKLDTNKSDDNGHAES